MKASPFLPLLIAAVLAGCGQKDAPVADVAAPTIAAMPAAAAPAPAPAPVAVAVATAAPDAARLAAGEKIYNATCLACHGAAVLGAPKLGDKAAWGPRLAQGMDVLYANSQNGLRMMPARGGNASLKEDELKSAVDFMVSKI
jgi:cytochrome c5